MTLPPPAPDHPDGDRSAAAMVVPGADAATARGGRRLRWPELAHWEVPGPLGRPAAVRRGAVLVGAYLLVRALCVAAVLLAAHQEGLSLERAFAPWDGPYYRTIVESGYPHLLPAVGHADLAQGAFFPGFPVVVRVLSSGLGSPVVATGVVLNVVLGAVCVLLVDRLARGFLDGRRALGASLLFVAMPGSVVFGLFMSDPLLVTLAAGGLLLLLERRWVASGVVAMAATATRPNGLALVLAAVVAAAMALRRGGDRRSLWAPLLAPLGVLGYWAYLGAITGRPDAWFVIQDRFWHQGLDFGVRFLYLVVHPVRLSHDLTYMVMEAGFVFLVLAVWCWVKGARLPLLPSVYTAALVAQMVLFSGVGPRPRFLLAAFPLVWLYVQRLAGRWWVVIGVLTASAQVFLAWLFASQYAIY